MIQAFCPVCNFDEDGATLFQGQLFNPCDPGCCTSLACPVCGRVYKLVEVCKTPCECHYHSLFTPDPNAEGGGMELVNYLQEQGYKKSWPREKEDA